MTTRRLTIDLVTERPDGAFVLVLVEEGPWARGETEAQLRRIQDRLNDCVDARLSMANLLDPFIRVSGDADLPNHASLPLG